MSTATKPTSSLFLPNHAPQQEKATGSLITDRFELAQRYLQQFYRQFSEALRLEGLVLLSQALTDILPDQLMAKASTNTLFSAALKDYADKAIAHFSHYGLSPSHYHNVQGAAIFWQLSRSYQAMADSEPDDRHTGIRYLQSAFLLAHVVRSFNQDGLLQLNQRETMQKFLFQASQAALKLTKRFDLQWEEELGIRREDYNTLIDGTLIMMECPQLAKYYQTQPPMSSPRPNGLFHTATASRASAPAWLSAKPPKHSTSLVSSEPSSETHSIKSPRNTSSAASAS